MTAIDQIKSMIRAGDIAGAEALCRKVVACVDGTWMFIRIFVKNILKLIHIFAKNNLKFPLTFAKSTGRIVGVATIRRTT